MDFFKVFLYIFGVLYSSLTHPPPVYLRSYSVSGKWHRLKYETQKIFLSYTSLVVRLLLYKFRIYIFDLFCLKLFNLLSQGDSFRGRVTHCTGRISRKDILPVLPSPTLGKNLRLSERLTERIVHGTWVATFREERKETCVYSEVRHGSRHHSLLCARDGSAPYIFSFPPTLLCALTVS